MPAPLESFTGNDGYCDICEKPVHFSARHSWLRDHYLCDSCGSIPRERAVMWVLNRFFPSWRKMALHESSPVFRGTSLKLKNECPRYVSSQFLPDVAPGGVRDGLRCEDLEDLSFADESLDLHITQDVMEHVFDPPQAFREIARTLRPGGAHVFTTPLVNKTDPSQVCARLRPDGSIEHLRDPEYHGNPVDPQGALVTMRWGFDICRHIFDACGSFTNIIELDNLEHGIRAEYIEVLITWKSREPAGRVQKLIGKVARAIRRRKAARRRLLMGAGKS